MRIQRIWSKLFHHDYDKKWMSIYDWQIANWQEEVMKKGRQIMKVSGVINCEGYRDQLSSRDNCTVHN